MKLGAIAEFEWDEREEIENKEKHKVSFYEAQKVFLDKNRIIAKSRIFCFGKEDRVFLELESINKKHFGCLLIDFYHS